MPFFSFIDKHPSEVPKPQRPVNADEAMTDWIREDRQARQEQVSRNVQRTKVLGMKAVAGVATLALAAGLIHEAAGAAGQEEAAAANRDAQVAKAVYDRPHPPVTAEHQ